MNCELISSFFEIVDMIVNEQRTPKDYGDGLLYHAEITFLDTIHTHPGAIAKELAEVLGVTRGAVTQVAAKLSAKGLIEGYTLPGDKRERRYRTTARGEQIRAMHQEYHRRANETMRSYFCSLKEEETATLRSFFDKVRECMPVSEFACCGQGTCSCGAEKKGEAK